MNFLKHQISWNSFRW